MFYLVLLPSLNAMAAVSTRADPFTLTALTLLEHLQLTLNKQWDPILDVLRLTAAAPLGPNTPDADALPPLPAYPPRNVLQAILGNMLWTLSSSVAEREPVRSRLFPLLAMY